MPEFVVTDPNGKEFIVTAPEGTSQDDVLSYAKSQFSSAAQQPEAAAMTKTAAPFRGVGEMQLDPANPTQSVSDYFSRVRETPSTWRDVAKSTGPMALGVGGGIAGGAVAGPPGAVGGRAAGSMLGEYINQKVGLTEESGGQIAFAGGASVAGDTFPGIANAIARAVGPRLSGAGTVLRRLGIAQAEALPGSLRPPVPSSVLYDEVRLLNPSIDTKPIKAIATTLQANEDILLSKNASSLTAKTKSLIDDLAATPQAANFEGLWGTMKGINKQIGEAAARGGAELGALKQLKHGFAEAVENAANSNTMAREVAVKLKAANTAFKREISADTVDDIVAKNFARALEGTEEWSSSAAQAHRQLSDAVRKDKYLKDAFAPGALDRVLTAFDKIRQLPVRGAPAGADAGSKNVLKKTMLGTSVGEAVGQVIGLPTAVGAGLGNIAVFGATAIIGEAIKTPGGTKMLLKMLSAPGGFTAPKMAALATFLRAQTAETKEFETNFKSAMKNIDVPIQDKIQGAMERDQMKKDLQSSVSALEY